MRAPAEFDCRPKGFSTKKIFTYPQRYRIVPLREILPVSLKVTYKKRCILYLKVFCICFKFLGKCIVFYLNIISFVVVLEEYFLGYNNV